MQQYIHRKNIHFKKETERLDKSKILGVSIDSSKNSHKILLFSFRGNCLEKPFSIDTLQSGYELLKKKINAGKKKIKAEKVYIAIEHAGSYSENLYNHLHKDYKTVVYVSPNAVASNRKQRMLRGLKTDNIDVGAIGDLLIRGEFLEQKKQTFIYKNLKNLIYFREKKILLNATLKNQIAARIHKIYPGLTNPSNKNETIFKKTNYRHKYVTGIFGSGKTIQELIDTPDDVLLKELGYKNSHLGPIKVRQIKIKLKKLLQPEKKFVKEDLKLLKSDLMLLKNIRNEITLIDEKIIQLGKKTDAKYVMGQIKGISDIMAAMYVGLVGNFKNFKSAEHVYSFSGLSPQRYQSGSINRKSIGIKRTGNRKLRSLLFLMASKVIISEPTFKRYYASIKKKIERPWKKNRIAVCRKLNKILFALIRDKKPFIENHWKA